MCLGCVVTWATVSVMIHDESTSCDVEDIHCLDVCLLGYIGQAVALICQIYDFVKFTGNTSGNIIMYRQY